MAQEAKGIRYQSEHFATVQGLMHSVNEQSLMAEHRKQSGKKATGVDGVSKAQYDENAKENIQRLVERMKKFQYKPLPVRRTYIPKANGKLRPLGIPAYEDRLAALSNASCCSVVKRILALGSKALIRDMTPRISVVFPVPGGPWIKAMSGVLMATSMAVRYVSDKVTLECAPNMVSKTACVTAFSPVGIAVSTMEGSISLDTFLAVKLV